MVELGSVPDSPLAAPARAPGALLAQADLLLLLASLFETPSENLRGRLADAREFASELTAASRLPGDRAFLEAFRGALDAALREGDETWICEHTRLFDAAIVCPANEASYVRRDKGAILADIAAFHRAFGLASRSVAERPDHIVAELEVVALLLVLWARAQDERRDDDAHVTSLAVASFARDHLGEWIATFAETLAATSHLPHHVTAAAALALLWDALSTTHGWPLPRAADASTIDTGADVDPYECGFCPPPAAEDESPSHPGSLPRGPSENGGSP